ncbi:MAG: molybdopterin-dependent oxidoreductase, partial [Gemmatimonadetes bacterium]|nr:molybdopterin-dependent oxidoreductase [Gemmatimonadota bacterium]
IDGSEVFTQSPKSIANQKAVMEYLLINHPLDCPVCDQAGECHLQDYSFKYGRSESRFIEDKIKQPTKDIGPHVTLYADRCIMCTRCVRFTREVTGTDEIGVFGRGNQEQIDIFPGKALDNELSGNVVDICPVGALVSKDFLHKARAWDLDHTPSVCASCSQGCNIELHTRDNLVQRLKPRANHEVNGHWMCDYGRANYEWYNRAGRLEEPSSGRGERRRGANWKSALEHLFVRLVELAGTEVRVVGSPSASVEALGALLALAEAAGRAASRVFRSRRAESEDPMPGFPLLVRRRDLAANVDGARLLGFERVGDGEAAGGLEEVAAHDGIVVVLGDELADQSADFGGEAALYVYMGHFDSPAAGNADFVLPITTAAEEEGTFVNAQGRVQRYWQGLQPPGAARPAWLVLGALAGALTGGGTLASAAEAFAAAAAAHAPLEGLSYEALGELGAELAAEPAHG